jgi:hypothetical protein
MFLQKSFSKNSYFSKIIKFAVFGLIVFSMTAPANASITNLVDFNNTNDLTDKFNSDGSAQFTNEATGGIGDTGSIDVPLGTTDVWTTKQGYSVAGAGDVYTFSAYFKIQANSGYGGLGFSTQSTNSGDFQGSPETGIGMAFHGGGGAFINNRVSTNVSWPPDLVLGNWYKMILEVTAEGNNTYDLVFQIWNSDADGVLGTMKTEKTQNDVVNADLGAASIIHGYFSAAGSRMDKIDDFVIDLEGGAVFVEEGAPILSTTAVTDVTGVSASSGGNVTDDQGAAITSRGVCWSEASPATTADECTTDGTGTGIFSSAITGLSPETNYFVRAYATNSEGTSYGAEETFTTDVAVTYDLEYTAGVGGTLTGTTSQTVLDGEDGTAVTAVPDDGYEFTQWSDTSTSNPRTDLNVSGDITVSAQFSLIPPPEPASSSSTTGTSMSVRMRNLASLGGLLNLKISATEIKKETETDKKCEMGEVDRVLRLGSKGEDVRSLQKFLNCSGFLLGENGPGSPGNETVFFSVRTHRALIDFQEHYKDEILAPLNLQKGTGIFAELSKKKASGK